MDSRYLRQTVLEQVGSDGQQRLGAGSVLIAGLGGLGCPCAAYLAGSGVGHLGLVDGDRVEAANLHRQTLHTEEGIGTSKCDSAATALKRINSTIRYTVHKTELTEENALELIRQYDVVVDATDNIHSRFLIGDACGVLRKPLVSGAALGVNGQLSVYSHLDGPCYRCIHTQAPASSLSCAEAGVLGPITGVIGSMQAMEAIKILLGQNTLVGKMLFYNGITMLMGLVRLRPRSLNCSVCLDAESPGSPLNLPPVRCPREDPLMVFDTKNRVDWGEYARTFHRGDKHVLIDVREMDEHREMSLPHTTNIPLSVFMGRLEEIRQLGQTGPLYLLCRRGIRSKRAVEILQRHGIQAKDVIGGLCLFAEAETKIPFK